MRRYIIPAALLILCQASARAFESATLARLRSQAGVEEQTPSIADAASPVPGVDADVGMVRVQAGGKLVPFEKLRLANGLTVILAPNESLPVAITHLLFKVGARDEPPNYKGGAHHLEHLLAGQGNSVIGGEEADRLVAGRGGSGNASTDQKRTDYFYTLPSHQLDTGLWLLSNILGFHKIDQASSEHEKEVVIQEGGMYEGKAYGHLIAELQALAYPDPKHPYHTEVVGDPKLIRAFTLDDIDTFVKGHYGPSNAVLTVYGGFDRDKVLRSIARYFHPKSVARGAPAAPFAEPPYAPFEGRQERVYRDPQIKVPNLVLCFRVPPGPGPDSLALDALAGLLGGGPSSRLFSSLVREKGLATDVEVMPYIGMFFVAMSPAPGVRLDALEEAALSEIEALARSGASRDELEGLRNREELSLRTKLSDPVKAASALAEAEQAYGDPGRPEKELEMIQELTSARLREAAARYLRRDRVGVLKYLPAGEGGGS